MSRVYLEGSVEIPCVRRTYPPPPSRSGKGDQTSSGQASLDVHRAAAGGTVYGPGEAWPSPCRGGAGEGSGWLFFAFTLPALALLRRTKRLAVLLLVGGLSVLTGCVETVCRALPRGKWERSVGGSDRACPFWRRRTPPKDEAQGLVLLARYLGKP